MPIVVPCPGCRSKLNAPDTAAGKRVKCPKCAKVLQVPEAADDFEVVDDDFDVVEEDDFEVVEEPKKKLKPVVTTKRKVVEDEDDEEEEEERPRKKGKKKPPPKSNTGLYIGLGIAAVLLIGIGGFFALSGKSKTKEDPTKIEWVAFESPDHSFSAQFPGGPASSGDMWEITKRHKDGEKAKKAMEDAKAGMAMIGVVTEAWSKQDKDRIYAVGFIAFPPKLGGAVPPLEQEMMKAARNPPPEDDEKLFSESTIDVGTGSIPVFYLGPKNGSSPTGAAAFVRRGERLFFIIVNDKNPFNVDDPMVKAFLGKFTVLPYETWKLPAAHLPKRS